MPKTKVTINKAFCLEESPFLAALCAKNIVRLLTAITIVLYNSALGNKVLIPLSTPLAVYTMKPLDNAANIMNIPNIPNQRLNF
ncbi:hypothetical protein D3C71_1005050 [compost metagenome]